MRKSGILAGLAVAGLMTAGASAGIVETNAGLDRFFTGGWSDAGSNFAGFRDNIDDNGDVWLGANIQHIVKAPYGASDGTTDAEGFVGIFRGAAGDTVAATYSFVAPSAITEQDWVIKATVNRLLERNAALRLSVQVNGGGFVNVDTSSTFYNAGSSGDILVDLPFGGFTANGPTETRTADLSALGIQAGDNVDYRITYAFGRHIGLGVQFIPEPASLALLGLGGLALLRRKN